MFDFIHNGQAHGDVASILMNANFDTGALRPYVGDDGRTYITVNQKGIPTAVPLMGNAATATLRKDEWKQLDKAIIKAAKPRLRAVADIRSAGLTYTIPNGMGKTVLQTENIGDINAAVVSMDGLREGPNDRPQIGITNLPLPIIHKDFSFSARQIATSQNAGSPIDTTSAELAGRRVAEEAEKLLIGVSTVADSYAYGGGTIYGYTDFPNRLTKTITSPTASAWTAATLVAEVLAMRDQSTAAYHYGPWMLYSGAGWDQYLDNDFKANGSLTLRERIKKIHGIQDVRRLDYLTGYTLIMVQMTSEVVREVIGMDITTVKWESQGGMLLNFKVMAILVPQIRADQNDRTGIVHATV